MKLNFNKMRYNLKSNDKCLICLKKYKLFKKPYVTTCGHKFHLKCIQKWLYYENRSTCPICNKPEHWTNPDIFLRLSGY